MKYKPKDKSELSKLLKDLIKERGNSGNFNDIDTSSITDLSGLFLMSDFNGDISKWDVSNVANMSYMFLDAEKFNQDISEWDVSNVTDMGNMFSGATSFNQDISNWNVSNVTNVRVMFDGTPIKNKAKMWFPECYI